MCTSILCSISYVAVSKPEVYSLNQRIENHHSTTFWVCEIQCKGSVTHDVKFGYM
uniref:Uncharacterized protein n=1 Tax=Arion vulgaris TaxID=1028688 RepID=A0A0B6Z6B7_9EUPU